MPPGPAPTSRLPPVLSPHPSPRLRRARQGCLVALRELLERLVQAESVKVDINWQDKQGKTPIFYAIEYGHTKVCSPAPPPARAALALP